MARSSLFMCAKKNATSYAQSTFDGDFVTDKFRDITKKNLYNTSRFGQLVIMKGNLEFTMIF